MGFRITWAGLQEMLIFVLLKWLITIINLAQWLILKGVQLWWLPEVKCTGKDVFCWLWEGLPPSLKTKTMSELRWLRAVGSKPLCREGRSGGRTCTVRMPSCQPVPAELPAGLPGMRSVRLPPRCCLEGPLRAAPAFLFSCPHWESRSNVSAGGIMVCYIVKKDLTAVNFNVSDRNDIESLCQCSLGVMHS